jgi:hypothetical protein
MIIGPLPLVSVNASATVAMAVTLDNSVPIVERMSSNAVRSSGVHAGRAVATDLVLAGRYGLQMIRSYTCLDAAQVVELFALWD